MSKKGFSIVELIIVIVIISIISTFTVLAVSRFLTNSKMKIDQETVSSLNSATTSFYLLSKNQPIFDEALTNEEKIEVLYAEGFLSNQPIPNTSGASFIWDEEFKLWYLSIDGNKEALSIYGSTPNEIVPNITQDILTYYNENESYPRTWGDYRYTDIGLNVEDWDEPIGHVYYTPSGSMIFLEPEQGYQFILTKINNETVTMKDTLNYNLIYDTKSNKWYYHSISSDNEVNISSLVIETY